MKLLITPIVAIWDIDFEFVQTNIKHNSLTRMTHYDQRVRYTHATINKH